MIHATALLRKMGQEAGKRRSSLQAEEASFVDGLPLINECGVYESSKNTNVLYNTGKLLKNKTLKSYQNKYYCLNYISRKKKFVLLKKLAFNF